MKRKLYLAMALIVLVAISVREGKSETGAPRRAGLEAGFFAKFQAPALEYRPWVRWWWPGNDVEDQELRREVDLLADNFFGGAEIQVFSSGLNPKAKPEEMARRLSFDSDDFYRHLAAALAEAKTRGMPLDLTLGSGWPSGGTHITPAQGLKTLLTNELILRGPKKISVKLPGPKKTALYYIFSLLEKVLHMQLAEFFGDRAKLFAVVAAPITGGERSRSPLDFADRLQLDSSRVQVLSDQVDAEGRLTWQVPEGRWAIIPFYILPEGERPTLDAQADPGFVADHYDAPTIFFHLDHLLGERTGLQKFFGAPVRAVFNDSIEFKAERIVTPDFLAEFKRRRGYDVTPWLPAVMVPGADCFFFEAGGINRRSAWGFSNEDRRVQSDYALTLSDLFIERFVDTTRKYCREHGLLSRFQAHGLDTDLLRAYGHADIPETEQLYAGGAEMFLKMASSGAHLYNHPVVTAESMVWSGKDYMTTPLKIKAAADKLFFSGINQIIYHGFPYRKDREYGETGWEPFSSPFFAMATFSSNISEANSFWKYLPALNRYISRCQYALRQGRSEVDIVVYYPWLGFPSSLSSVSDHHELLFNGYFEGQESAEAGKGVLDLVGWFGSGAQDERVKWLLRVWPLLDELDNHGYTWEWVNDESLAQAEVREGKVVIRENTYSAVVFAEAPHLAPVAATRMAELSGRGAAFLFLGNPPAAQSGFNNFPAGDWVLKTAMPNVLAAKRSRRIVSADQAAMAFIEIGVEPGVRYAGGSSQVRFLKRRLVDGGQVIFFRNPSRDIQSFQFRPRGGCEDGRWLDPWTGEIFRPALNQEGMIAASLAPYGSMLLVCGSPGVYVGTGSMPLIEKTIAQSDDWPAAASLPQWPLSPKVSRVISLSAWKLSVRGDDVAGGRLDLELPVLRDWRELKALRFCSSPGRYSAVAEISGLGPAARVFLDLGWLYGAAEVKINNRDVGVLLIPPYQLDISKYLVAGNNLIEVTVVPALQNRLVGKAARDKRYAQFKDKEDTLLPNGLLGPTRILVIEK